MIPYSSSMYTVNKKVLIEFQNLIIRKRKKKLKDLFLKTTVMRSKIQKLGHI